eukprot:c13219_g1_i2.p1 GENE.c13219_g1_i2~~c13219_g1_i2.p1  ORF type:complete len:450 (+),score=150.18 c13219_g1_i2:26-1351(+)
MRKETNLFNLSIFVFSLLFLTVHVKSEDTSFITLDANNFQSTIDGHDIVMVCFYHSKGEAEEGLDKEYVLAADKLKDKSTQLLMAVVDCAFEKTLQKKYQIEDFPSVRLFRDGKMYHYRRALEANSIISFSEKLLQTSVKTISSTAEAVDLTSSSNSDKSVLMGFFGPKDTKEYEVFLNVASSFQASDDPNTQFSEVVDPSILKQFEIVYTPTVFLFRPNGDVVGYTGMFSEQEFADWITISTTPTLRELTPETFLSVFEDNTPTLLTFIDKSDPTTGSLLTSLTETSVHYLHKINFVFTERTHFEGLAEKMSIPPTGNVITILDFHTREHFIMEQPSDTKATTKDITSFCEKFLKKELIRAEDGEMKSQNDDKIPETIVIANPTTDRMMDFYVPWCDFYIHIGVPHSGIPAVALLSHPPNLDHSSLESNSTDKKDEIPKK